MQLRASDALYQLKRLRVISNRWIMARCSRFLAGGGATVDENGHVVRQRDSSRQLFELAQRCFRQALACWNSYGVMNVVAETCIG
jgi:hypothetical protein